jgi:hypothetical protein
MDTYTTLIERKSGMTKKERVISTTPNIRRKASKGKFGDVEKKAIIKEGF